MHEGMHHYNFRKTFQPPSLQTPFLHLLNYGQSEHFYIFQFPRPKMHSLVDLLSSAFPFFFKHLIIFAFFFFFKPNGPRTVIPKERDHMSRESDHLALTAAKNRRGSRGRETNVPPLPPPVSVKMSLFQKRRREMEGFLSSSQGNNTGSHHKGSGKNKAKNSIKCWIELLLNHKITHTALH